MNKKDNNGCYMRKSNKQPERKKKKQMCRRKGVGRKRTNMVSR